MRSGAVRIDWAGGHADDTRDPDRDRRLQVARPAEACQCQRQRSPLDERVQSPPKEIHVTEPTVPGHSAAPGTGPSMKQRIKAAFRLLKALVTDERVPTPVRWLIGVSLAIKAVPLPDFGIDEVGLLLAFGLLTTVYRKRFTEVRADLRAQEATALASEQ